MSNLVAKMGPGFLQIYPCTITDANLYDALPKKRENCTNYISTQLNYSGKQQIGYLEAKENVNHSETYTVECM